MNKLFGKITLGPIIKVNIPQVNQPSAIIFIGSTIFVKNAHNSEAINIPAKLMKKQKPNLNKMNYTIKLNYNKKIAGMEWENGDTNYHIIINFYNILVST